MGVVVGMVSSVSSALACMHIVVSGHHALMDRETAAATFDMHRVATAPNFNDFLRLRQRRRKMF